MGPLFGVIMADYYVIRRAQVSIDELYDDDPAGRYYYSRGTNLNTLIAFIPASLVTLVIALVSAFSYLAAFSWPIGTALGAALCIGVNRWRPNARARAKALETEAHRLSYLQSP